MGDLSYHFSLSEFRYGSSGPMPPEELHSNIKDTIEFLESLRFLMNCIIMERKELEKYPNVGIKITPHGGYRDPYYRNKKDEYGKPVPSTSRHCKFQAADVTPSGGYKHGFRYMEFYRMALLIDEHAFLSKPYRIGRYIKDLFVHIDCAYGYGGTRWYN